MIQDNPKDSSTVTGTFNVQTGDLVVFSNKDGVWVLPYDGGEVHLNDPRWMRIGDKWPVVTMVES